MSKKFKIILISCLCLGIFGGFSEFFGPSLYVDEESVLEGKDYTRAAGDGDDQGVRAPTVAAEGAILIDGKSGDTIYEKDADKKLYPASTTKIMTALVALEIIDEIGADLSSEVIVPAEAAGAEGSSVYLKAGEKVTLKELMYGMMLQSGNDAAQAVAICCGGTLDEFVSRMNLKAQELGCASTHFMNPSGLFDEEHYTTARDLAIISRAAMEREDFREIVATLRWESSDTGRIFNNKNKTISQYEGATGIKIGYTERSGRTLAASAKRDGKELIAVVLNDHNWFNDAYSLMDYGFARWDEDNDKDREVD